MSRIIVKNRNGFTIINMDIRAIVASIMFLENTRIKKPFNIETHTDTGTEIITVLTDEEIPESEI